MTLPARELVASETAVVTEQPKTLLDHLTAHLRADHDISLETDDDGGFFVDRGAFRMDLKPGNEGLMIRIAAPNAGALVFFKDGVAAHLAEFDPSLAGSVRWSGETSKAGDLPPNFRILDVVESQVLFTGMQRVTVRVPDVAKLMQDGLHFKLMLPATPDRKPVWPRMAENGAPVWPQGDDALHARFITIVGARPERGEVDLDIVRHGVGLISVWAQSARAGDQIGAMGPTGLNELPEHNSYFFAADMTALSSLARVMELVPKGASGNVVAAAPDDCDLESYLPATSLDVHRFDPDVFESAVPDSLARLTRVGQTEYGWFAGEFSGAQTARKWFKTELGLDKTRQLSVAYWRRDVAGYGD